MKWKRRALAGTLRIFCSSLIGVGLSAAADEINTNTLPPAATGQIDFARDIRPILESSCLRCHGPQKPRSHFRLDNRASALKGGDNGIAIIPGNSEASPLIENVAGLDPDLQMPPPDKGEPLTPEQIGLLRAWVDQGAHWDTNETIAPFQASATTGVRWIDVHGDKAKFREVEGLKEGWVAGLDHFEIHEQDRPDKTFSIEGRIVPRDEEYQVQLKLQKTDVGFVDGGFDTWRKYYDDIGGFAPMLPTNTFGLDRDLHMDIGRAWFDIGSTLPDRPQIVFGYEYQFRQGDRSTLEWGSAGAGGDERDVMPAAEHVDEKVNILKLDITQEISGWQLADSARVEYYHLETSRQNAPADFSGAPPGGVELVAEEDQHIQGMNTFSASKQLAGWLFVSSGYLYSQLNGSASLNQTPVDASGAPSTGDQWSGDIMSIKRQSQVASVSGLLGPWSGLSLSLGVQGDWTRQESFGNENLQGSNAFFTNPAPAMVIGDIEDRSARENAALRFTKIPYTVLFAEGRLLQESLGRFYEGQILNDSGTFPFARTIEASIQSEQYRVGFDTSPWTRLSFGANFQHSLKSTDYNNSQLDPGEDPFYPGFMLWRDVTEDQTQARLVWRATPWLKTSLNCRFQETDYNSATPSIPDLGVLGGSLQAAKQQAQVYSINAVLTPFKQWYLSGTFSYTQSRIATSVDDLGPVVPYQGHIISVLGSASYAVNSKTDLHFAYLFSEADYGQENGAIGLPLGIDYERHDLQAGVTRRFGRNLAANLAYTWAVYREPTSGGASNYRAQGVFASITMAWP